MTTYEVDIKAFITVTIKAESEDKAREIADQAVELMSPDDNDIAAINFALGGTCLVLDAGSFAVDGTSDVEIQ